MLIVVALADCSQQSVDLSDRACGDACLPGYACDPQTQTCVACAGDCDYWAPSDPAATDPTGDGSAGVCDGIEDGPGGMQFGFEQDNDGDGYVECSPWVGSVPGIKGGSDCNDGDPLVYPGAPELCDGVANACESSVPADELDSDHDGYVTCSGWNDRTGKFPGLQSGDCDDHNAAVHPGVTEVLDGIDNNCIEGIDECVGTCVCTGAQLLSCYTLDSMSMGIAKDGAGTLDGAISPSSTSALADGRIGKSYEIDPSYTVVVPNDNSQDSSTFTLQAWVYIDQTAGSGYLPIVDVQDEYAISIGPSSQAHCGVLYYKSLTETAEPVEGGTIPQATWTHVACSSDGTTITLYLNGLSIGTNTPSPSVGSFDNRSLKDVGLGVNATGGTTSASAWLNGRLDHVMLFTEARSARDICLAAGRSATTCNGL